EDIDCSLWEAGELHEAVHQLELAFVTYLDAQLRCDDAAREGLEQLLGAFVPAAQKLHEACCHIEPVVIAIPPVLDEDMGGELRANHCLAFLHASLHEGMAAAAHHRLTAAVANQVSQQGAAFDVEDHVGVAVQRYNVLDK